MEKLPVYEAYITTVDDGIFTISLVDEPAVESNFICFNKETYDFKVEDEEQRIVTGVLMRCNYPIIRKGHYIRFPKETIELMAEKMLADKTHNYINLQHNHNEYVEDIYLKEVFIKDVEKGINPKGFENIEDGSLFATYKVFNDEVWKRIKKGEFKGFSIEINTHSVVVEDVENEMELYSEILDMLKKIENKIK